MSRKNYQRERVWERACGRCAHCGQVIATMSQTVDHVIPKTHGGGNDRRNLMPLCYKCNRSRASGDIIPETYYRYAADWALHDIQDYILEWKMERTNMAGELFLKHPDRCIL